MPGGTLLAFDDLHRAAPDTVGLLMALYALPYDARYPTICLDEKPVVPHADVRPGLPPAPGQVERHGTANLFVMVEPLAGWRHLAVAERRSKRDYGECLRWLVADRYPRAKCICVVQVNLNTHTAGALYEAFPPKQALAPAGSDELSARPESQRRSWGLLADDDDTTQSRHFVGERPVAPMKGLGLGRGDTLQHPGKPVIQSTGHFAVPGNDRADHADGQYQRRSLRRVRG